MTTTITISRTVGLGLLTLMLLAIALPASANEEEGYNCNGIGNCNRTTDKRHHNNTATGGTASSRIYAPIKTTNKQRQYQGQDQDQYQGQGQSQGQVGIVKDGDVSVQDNSVVKHEATVSSAIPAALTASEGTCKGSATGALQGASFGLAVGSTITDEKCDTRKDTALLAGLGYKDAALARMCMDDDLAEALADKCPSDGTPTPKEEDTVTASFDASSDRS